MSKQQRILAALFLGVGVMLLGLGIYMLVVPAIPQEFTGTTEAVIADIEVSYSRSSSGGRQQRANHTVFVEYEAEGQPYYRPLGYYSSGMYIGQSVEIEFDTRDPSKISSPGGRLVAMIIILGLGAVVTIVGAVLQFKKVPVYINGRRVD